MKKTLFFLLLLVVTSAIIPLFLPKTMYVEEEHTFNADISTVFQQYHDMRKFTKFDNWSRKDPNIQIEYSNPSVGENAYYIWKSKHKELGEGKMQIVESKLDEFINYDLSFGEYTGNQAEAIFQEVDENTTRVIWSFSSAEAKYPFQVFNFFMKRAVKENLKQGMLNLDKILKEKQKNANSSQSNSSFNITSSNAQKLFGVLQTTSLNPDEINTAVAETMGFVKSYLKDANQLNDTDLQKPVVLWKLLDPKNDKAMFYCGYFIDQNIEEKDGMEYVTLPASQNVFGEFKGKINDLPAYMNKLNDFASSQNIQIKQDFYIEPKSNLPLVDVKHWIVKAPIIEP